MQQVQYGAILADPPWSFRTWSTGGLTHRAAEHHYRTMPLDKIAALPVAEWAAPTCALFMWVVDSHHEQALSLMRSWGFEYKTVAFIWDKGGIGLGYWTRKQAEFCLMGTRGKPKRLDAGVRQIIREPRREHSRKPDETRARIQRLVAGPYLEMFARESAPGWDAWGNETTKFDDAAAVAEMLA